MTLGCLFVTFWYLIMNINISQYRKKKRQTRSSSPTYATYTSIITYNNFEVKADNGIHSTIRNVNESSFTQLFCLLLLLFSGYESDRFLIKFLNSWININSKRQLTFFKNDFRGGEKYNRQILFLILSFLMLFARK